MLNCLQLLQAGAPAGQFLANACRCSRRKSCEVGDRISRTLVALLLLLLPAPASAFSPTALQQADAPLPAPTPNRLEPTPDAHCRANSTANAEPTIEPARPHARRRRRRVIDLHATAGRLRGRVEIGWSVASAAGCRRAPSLSWNVRPTAAPGVRSRPATCNTTAKPKRFGCTDSRLASGATYAYRVCLTGKATSCSNALTTDPVSVKAP